MRTKIGLLSILTAVLLTFGGVAVAQDYGTETDPQDTTATQRPAEATAQGTMDGDLDVDAEANVRNDRLANDQYADDELPRTASFLPALGALGLLSLAGGAALRGRKS